MAVHVSVMTSFETAADSISGRGATMTANDFASLNGGEPPSVTRTVIALLVPASASVVVQEKIPVTLSRAAFVGAPGSRLNVSVFAGMSASVAEFVTTRVVPAWM